MAVCPKCKGTMGQTDAVCPHCGHDFPPSPAARTAPWWVHILVLAAFVGLVLISDDYLILRIIVGVLVAISWASLVIWMWRVAREEEGVP
jgi:hypothetical protein